MRNVIGFCYFGDVLRVIDIAHDRIRQVEVDIFLQRFAADCMTHRCRCRHEGDRVLLDACCRYGADVDMDEKRAILQRADDIAPVLAEQFRDPRRWFNESEPEVDPDYPSGMAVRTAVAGADEASGCVFLQHDQRGCALHRAALKHGFAPEGSSPRCAGSTRWPTATVSSACPTTTPTTPAPATRVGRRCTGSCATW
jgi:hypothetical protein